MKYKVEILGDFMKQKLIAIPILCTVLLAGCSKTSPLLEKNKDYIGEWKSENSTLTIKKNGEAKYEQHHKTENKTSTSDIKTSSASNIKAPISQLDGQHLQIGQGDLSQDFKITKAPFQQEGKWHVILNNENYTKN